MSNFTEYSVRSQLELFTTRERMGIDSVRQSFIEWLALEDIERQEKYTQYRDYYNGDHDVMLTNRQKAFLELSPNQDFSANYCSLVVDELARRMTVSGFDVEESHEIGRQLWRWWRLARMDSRQDDTHLAAIRDGDAYVIVSWDQVNSRPQFHANLAYDGFEGVKVHYSDETGQIVMASKRWVIKQGEEVGEVRRLNLYYPDRVERYVSDEKNGGVWKEFTGDGQPGVLDWTDRSGKPLGVPVFHLKYKPAGYRWGRSILEDVIPMQNALNKAIVDVIAAADTTGFRLYWATGTDLIDEDDEPISIHPGVILTSTSPDAKFGYIPGENLRPLIEVVDMCKITIAQMSETPMHLFQVSGQNASEGAQKQQEVGMINKAEKLGIAVGNFWEDCMRMAILLSNTFGGTNYPADLIIQTTWADMEVRDKVARRKEMAETAKVWVDSGSSLEEAAIEAGIPEDRAKDLGRLAVPILGAGIVPGTTRAGDDAETE